MSPKLPIAAEKLSILESLLQGFAATNSEVHLLLLTSEDGFEVAAHPAKDARTARIAAMSSSIQALSDSLMREVGLARSNSLIVEADAGAIVVIGLHAAKPRMSLSIFTSKQQLLGKLLWAVRSLAANIEAELLR
jgi:predicted regulator of Ras-like GTPase activity (Roadblock/LC7/MglB family)